MGKYLIAVLFAAVFATYLFVGKPQPEKEPVKEEVQFANPGLRYDDALGSAPAIVGTNAETVLNQVESGDTDALDDQMAREIEKDEPRIRKWATRILSNAETPSKKAFFLLRSIVRHARQPADVLVGVLNSKVEDHSEEPMDEHHSSDQSRLGILKSYLFDILQRERRGNVGSGRDHEVFQTKVFETAKNEPNLAVVREAITWIRDNADDGERKASELIAMRSKEEREFLQDL